MINKNKPLIAIMGPTASGKTSLAVELAKKFGGEIICADSRTIYKGMDIGTAKPSIVERDAVPHWGLDLVEPGEYFSVSDFKEYALKKIHEIRERGNVPFLVGGTGLYIDSIIFDYNFGPPVDENKRKLLDEMTIEQLHYYCKNNNITLPENKFNKRYVIRAIERNGSALLRREQPIENAIIVGISTDRNELRSRIDLRTESFFANGVVNEATNLGLRYGWDNEAMKGNVYPLIKRYVDGEITFEEMKDKSATLDWQLAKRQITWLKRNSFLKWGSIVDLRIYLSDLLAKL